MGKRCAIHPEAFRIHSPAWDHRKLFTAGRALELELGLTPLDSRTRDREKVPQRAADREAYHGIHSLARWAKKQLGPALRAGQVRSWDDVHDVCASLGVVPRPHGNAPALSAEYKQAKAAASGSEPSSRRPQISWKLQEPLPGDTPPSRPSRRRTYGRSTSGLWTRPVYSGNRNTASREPRRLKEKYRNQRGLLAAVPVSAHDRKRLSQQLGLRQAIESRALKQTLAVQRRAIQKTPHPGTWRHFVAGRVAHREARAV